jgi:glycosyltransferase 2 family protein
MKPSDRIISIIKLLFTIFLLFFIFKSVDLSGVRRNLQAFPIGYWVGLLMVCWAGQLICSERWRILATSLQMPETYFHFVQMYFVGMFCNIGLPSLIGGDGVKAYMISRRSGKSLHLGLASVLQDRAAGLITLLLYGSAAIAIHPINWRGFPLWLAYFLCWIAIAAVILLALKGDILYRKYLKTETSTYRFKILTVIAEFHQAFRIRKMPPGSVFRIILYSFINSALVLWIFQQVTFAAGQRVGIVQFSALYPLVTLATMMPITLSGIGVREWVYVEALTLAGIPRELGLAISLATSALSLICNLGGVVFLPGIPKDLLLKSKNAAVS